MGTYPYNLVSFGHCLSACGCVWRRHDSNLYFSAALAAESCCHYSWKLSIQLDLRSEAPSLTSSHVGVHILELCLVRNSRIFSDKRAWGGESVVLWYSIHPIWKLLQNTDIELSCLLWNHAWMKSVSALALNLLPLVFCTVLIAVQWAAVLTSECLSYLSTVYTTQCSLHFKALY